MLVKFRSEFSPLFLGKVGVGWETITTLISHSGAYESSRELMPSLAQPSFALLSVVPVSLSPWYWLCELNVKGKES